MEGARGRSDMGSMAGVVVLACSFVLAASTVVGAAPGNIEELLGEWTLAVDQERLSGGPATAEEVLRLRLEDGVLEGTLTLASGARPVNGLTYSEGTLTWTAPARAPGATEPKSERERIFVGPTLYYEAKVHDGYLEGFKRAYFGASEFTAVKAGSGVTPPQIAAPSAAAAAPGGEPFTFLREETFAIGGQTHTVRVYRCNLFAAVLGLAPGETDIAVEFVLIPGGSFLMGTAPETRERVSGFFATPELMKDEAPQREVSIDPFLMARTEVTQAIWRGLAHLVGLPREPSMFEHAGDRAPVERVSWNHALLWLRGVNDAYDLELRLPSEAEWEYGTRAGTTTPLYSGKYPDNSPALDEIAWYYGNSIAEYPGAYDTGPYASEGAPESVGTQPVGGKKPNAFGLYDTLGNVYEWVADIAHGDYVGAPSDGRPWRGGEFVPGTLLNGPVTSQGPIVTARDHSYVPGRIRRGGSWRNMPYNTRAAIRAYRGPNFSDGNNGFRGAVSVPDDLPTPRTEADQR